MKYMIYSDNVDALPSVNYHRVTHDSTKDETHVCNLELNINLVDLGLPSGLKWTDRYVGASSITDVGKYFQWGDTSGYKMGTTSADTNSALFHSTWESCPFNDGATGYNQTYFSSISGDVVTKEGNYYLLRPEYDAIYQATNGEAKMVSFEQYLELWDNTKHQWAEIDGVSGMKFINKTNSNNWIFMPAGGCAEYGAQRDVGTYGFVWTNTLNTDGVSGFALPGDAVYRIYVNGDESYNPRSVSSQHRYSARQLFGVSTK